MRAWVTIGTSAVTASALTLLFIPNDIIARGELSNFVTDHWDLITLAWLSIYGMLVLLVNTAAEYSQGAAERSRDNERVKLYAAGLARTQYFTSILGVLLIGIGEWSLESRSSYPLLIEHLPALVAYAAILLAGAIGWLLLYVTLSSPPVGSRRENSMELRLLKEIAALLRDRPERMLGISEQVGQSPEETDQTLRHEIRDVGLAVEQLSRMMAAELAPLKELVSREYPTGVQAAIEQLAAEFQSSFALLDQSLHRVTQIRAEPMAAEGAPAASAQSSAARSQLSNELRELLQELNSSSQNS